ncbi:MAG: SDR family oxidoreductase [Cyanothece sp. SIO1E1]|nr:SDR family oxidoreductase [Cyanothece sp. SIO1E1]
MARFTGKTALVTGGSSGIGLATAQAFLQEGAKVAITGRNADTLQTAAAALKGDVETIQADVASMADIENMAARLAASFGTLNVVFVNAGIAKFAPADATPEELLDQVMDINFKGAFFTAQKLLPLMNHGSAMVFNTSINNQIGMPNASVYAASKAAVRSLVRTFANEWMDKGVRVNAISPGPIETPIMGKLGFSPEQLDGFAQSILPNIPMGRFGTPDEIAKAVLFAASDDASFMTGEEIVVDGGWTEV